MARPTPTGCSPEQRGQRDRRISTKSHRPTGGETHPVKHWHAKQYQQTYGHCAGHIPRRVFVTSPRSYASERTHPPRACRPPTSCLIAVGASRRKRTRAKTARISVSPSGRLSSAATMIEVWHWSAAYGTHLEPGCWTAAIGSGLTRAYRR